MKLTGKSMRANPILVLVAAAALGYPAAAAENQHPTWPCVQAKVPEISVGAVWQGPAIDDVATAWQNDPVLKDLVPRLAARRTPLADAQGAIADHLTGSAAERQEKARRLFAGLFAVLSRERAEVISGIERLARRQGEMIETIRADNAKLRAEQDASREPGKTDELAERIAWNTRIYEERRRTVRYVCEVPVLIDQRLFALARTIQQAIE
jgi:hypothetical protein